MTVLQAILSINIYPIPNNTVERFCIDRGLDKDDEYTKTIGSSQAYELATADTYHWLHGAPSIVEQESGVNNAIAIKENLLDMANKIYAKYDDPKFSGFTYGFVGEDWNA